MEMSVYCYSWPVLLYRCPWCRVPKSVTLSGVTLLEVTFMSHHAYINKLHCMSAHPLPWPHHRCPPLAPDSTAHSAHNSITLHHQASLTCSIATIYPVGSVHLMQTSWLTKHWIWADRAFFSVAALLPLKLSPQTHQWLYRPSNI